MHREDLEHIVHLFETSGQPVVISNDEFQFESIDELQDRLGTVPPTLRIRVNQPTVELVLRNMYRAGGEVKAVDPTNDGAPDSLYLKIHDFITKKQRSELTRWPGYLVTVLTSTVLIVLMFGIAPFNLHRLEGPVSLMMLSLFGTLLIGFSALWAMAYENRILLTKRAESPSYWKRAGDDLIGRLITFALSLLAGYLLGRFLPHK